MGLDQWAFATKGDQKIDLQTWRKHANLQGFMEKVWRDRGGRGDFNCIDLKLTKEDLQSLSDGHRDLPDVTGFFWGTTDQAKIMSTEVFVRKALELHNDGWEIIYSSWW